MKPEGNWKLIGISLICAALILVLAVPKLNSVDSTHSGKPTSVKPEDTQTGQSSDDRESSAGVGVLADLHEVHDVNQAIRVGLSTGENGLGIECRDECVDFLLRCLTESQFQALTNGVYEAVASPEHCTVYLKQSYCIAMGLESGVYRKEDIEQHENGREVESLEEATGFCVLFHEIEHTEQSFCSLFPCEAEAGNENIPGAYDVSAECMEDYYQELCVDEQRLDDFECRLLAEEICYQKGFKKLNSCICGGVSFQDNDRTFWTPYCEHCMRQCTTEKRNCEIGDQIDSEIHDDFVYRAIDYMCRRGANAYCELNRRWIVASSGSSNSGP